MFRTDVLQRDTLENTFILPMGVMTGSGQWLLAGLGEEHAGIHATSSTKGHFSKPNIPESDFRILISFKLLRINATSNEISNKNTHGCHTISPEITFIKRMADVC